jgi:hypothetical protein
LLSAVNEGIGACFVGAFQDNKVSEILELPKNVRRIGIICIGYPAEKPEKLERIDVILNFYIAIKCTLIKKGYKIKVKRVYPLCSVEI